jgi:hypothetical protein
VSDLTRNIHAIYDENESAIHPFIGEAYTEPRPDDLRIMALGINAYISDHEWEEWRAGHADDFASWFELGKYHFFPRAYRRGKELAEALLDQSGDFDGLQLRGEDGRQSFYVTNAVKVFLRASEGKSASNVSEARIQAHQLQWYRELDLLAAAGLMPHAIIVFGRPFWPWASRTFKMDARRPLPHIEVVGHRWTPGPGRHHINRYQLAGVERSLPLVGMAHPSSRRREGRVGWLLEQADFRELAGLPI